MCSAVAVAVAQPTSLIPATTILTHTDSLPIQSMGMWSRSMPMILP